MVLVDSRVDRDAVEELGLAAGGEAEVLCRPGGAEEARVVVEPGRHVA